MKLVQITLAVITAITTISTSAFAKDQERTAEKPMNQQRVDKAEGDTIVVRVVSTADCVNTPPTMKLIQETALELGLRIDISRQIVTTQEEANQYRFIGSPTIQIDGLDLQPEMRTNTKYGYT